MSDSSDEEKLDGITTPHGPAARGRTHPGGNRGYLYPEECKSTGQPATSHLPNGQEDITDQPPVTCHLSNGHYTRIFKSINHQSVAIQPPVIGQKISTQGKVSIHRPLVNRPPVTCHQTLYQSSFSEIHAMGMEFTKNNSKRVLLSPAFSKKSGGALFLVFRGTWCVALGAWCVVPSF